MSSKKVAIFSGGIFALLLVSLLILLSPPAATAETFLEKVDRRVLEDTEDGQTGYFLVMFEEQADVSGAADLHTKEEKGAYVTNLLRETAARTQSAVTAVLDKLGVSYRTYWISNMIAVKGDRQVVEAMARHQAIAKVATNRAMKLEEEPKLTPAEQLPEFIEGHMPVSPSTVEWGVEKIGAPDVWTIGYRGSGIVVANQDTGIQWDHPALVKQYRGSDESGETVDHNYHWWDAIHEDLNGNGSNPCGFSSSVPCDDHGHGTHTVGTAIGDDGADNQIGVAPDAKWIGCRNMESGTGRPSTYSECFQFFMAPHDLNGENPDSSLAPDVISNSWGCPFGAPPGGEECEVDSFKTTIENMRAGGIIVVVSNGNNGSACSSTLSPPGYIDAATSVGATSSTDAIASFSSRGPVAADGSNRIKPDISAPGVSVRSSRLGNSYGNSSGTSMAAPHVAGAVALLLNAQPALRGDVDAIEQALFSTAVERTTNQNCGGVPGTNIPNNTFGYGRLDIQSAVYATLELTPSISLTKTVGTDPSTCADSDSIDVAFDDNVTYCYTAKNTGNITFTDHTLVDDQLGSLLSNHTHELIPGATTFMSVTTTITPTSAYTATWSATSSNNLQANATASVTLMVSIPTAISLSDVEVTPTHYIWHFALSLSMIGMIVALGVLLLYRRGAFGRSGVLDE